jgi:hypothetical protein
MNFQPGILEFTAGLFFLFATFNYALRNYPLKNSTIFEGLLDIVVWFSIFLLGSKYMWEALLVLTNGGKYL